MTSQIGKKAIILSYLSHAYSEPLKESLIDFCKDNNFTIIMNLTVIINVIKENK
jgi:hypothetical protein